MKKITKKLEVRQGVEQLVLEIPEIVGRELHELVVGAGMRVLAKMLEAERERLCGPRYAHSTTRKASRAGHAPGELALGGGRVRVSRPRVRGVDGNEVKLKTWETFAGDDVLNERAVEQMVIGVSTRKYERSLEEVDVDMKTRGTSKSSVSRRFVALTEAKLDEMMQADLKSIDLAVLMIDGIAIDNHVVLVALGIDVDGKKHVLGIHEGATENATACTTLLANLVERGVRTDTTILVVIREHDSALGWRGRRRASSRLPPSARIFRHARSRRSTAFERWRRRCSAKEARVVIHMAVASNFNSERDKARSTH